MRAQRDELTRQVELNQREVLRAMLVGATPHWLQLDLSMAQIKALFALALARGEAVSMSGLASRQGVSLSDASRLVERLVQLDLVHRSDDQSDRRRASILLTEQGNALVMRLHQGGRERFASWLAKMSDEDLAALAQGLGALARLARGADQPPADEGS